MRFRSFFSLLFCLCLSVCIGFSIFSDDVFAAEGTKTLTPEQALQIFGDSLSCTYYDGSNYVDSVFTYDSIATLSSGSASWAKSAFGFQGGDSSGNGEQVLIYTADFSANSNPQYITVRVNPEYSFFNTQYVHCIAGLSSYNSLSSSAYSSPSWLWFKSDTGDIYSSYTDGTLSDLRGVKFWSGGRDWFDCTACAVHFEQSSTFSAYSKHISFYGNSPYTGGSVPMKYYFFLSCPVLSSDGDAQSGTMTGTTGGGSGGSGDINVNVDVNMDETNGLLGGLIDAVNGLIDKIAGLFVPSEEYLETYSEDMQELLQDHLGGVYTAIDDITEFIKSLFSVTPSSSFSVPLVTIPFLGGDSMTFGGYTVSLEVEGHSGFAFLYGSIKILFDFLVATAFLMMLKKKLYIFLSPDSEVTQA